jgi:very-short-patch-repair endonuclease
VTNGLLSTRDLRAGGLSSRSIRESVASGRLTRLRRGWFATAGTAPDLITAGRVGGRLSCVRALRLHGCWAPESPELHVRVSDGINVTRVPGSRIHRTEQRVTPGVDAPHEALRTALIGADLRTLVIIADSVVNRRLLTWNEVRAILSATPRGRRALDLHDPAAESGIETLVRLALRRHRIGARSQIVIPGVGRVDFLIGERLVIEADGYEWHGSREAFERDRERDRELVRRGYVVVRATYRQVSDDLDALILASLDVVRRRDHHWRAVHRSQLSAGGYLVDV